MFGVPGGGNAAVLLGLCADGVWSREVQKEGIPPSDGAPAGDTLILIST
jgi:hypothetical protein